MNPGCPLYRVFVSVGVFQVVQVRWDAGRMKSAWTGGQYSLVRVALASYLAVHFAALVPWSAELFSREGMLPAGSASPLLRLFPNVLALDDGRVTVLTLVALALVASLFLAIGWFDRIAAVVIWYVLACLYGRSPLIANPSLPFVGWLLLAHACLPAAPYGSWAARRRVDPRGEWSMPRPIYAASWIVMAAGYSYSGWTKLLSPSWVDGSAMRRVLTNPLARATWIRTAALALPDFALRFASWGALALELLYLPLALSRRARPWIWTAMLLMHAGLLVLVDFADLSFGMICLHLFTFDPSWVRAAGEGKDVVFYDGSCGLCHRAVRFVVAEDRDAVFELAPLGGERFAAVYGDGEAALPDSIVVHTASGRTLVKARAALHVLARLGGYWRVISVIARLLPVRLLDVLYDLVASSRYRIFGREKAACPILPPDLRSRFSA